MWNVRRIYDAKGADETYRVLVDRLWPRGVSKEDAALDLWAKEVTPSSDLRSQFHDDEIDYETFAKAYRHELEAGDALDELAETLDAQDKPVTLLTAVKDIPHSHLPTLQEALEAKLGTASSASDR